MSFSHLSFALLTAALSLPAAAQNSAPAPDAPPSVSSTLRPALDQVSQCLDNIGIRHWKAPSDVKSAADEDVSSIQRDLTGTLTGLLQAADAAPGSLPAAFAVYRNVDALYDTLLRVVLTANLAASDEEANALQGALASLEAARSTLGDSILRGTRAQEAELTRIRTTLHNAAPAARPAPVTTTVVDDGPADTPQKHKHTTKKPAPKPAPSTNGPSTPQ